MNYKKVLADFIRFKQYRTHRYLVAPALRAEISYYYRNFNVLYDVQNNMIIVRKRDSSEEVRIVETNSFAEAWKAYVGSQSHI